MTTFLECLGSAPSGFIYTFRLAYQNSLLCYLFTIACWQLHARGIPVDNHTGYTVDNSIDLNAGYDNVYT